VAVFIGSAVEHTAIARGFAVKNNYVTDQSQELTFYGVANIANSFFHAVGVGGAMSRTAVNSACHVKSPLSGIVTTAVVLVSIYKLVEALYWIPKATLSAIIITAVWPLISPPSVFYQYWRTSLADFVSSMIAFWVSLFYSTQWGIVSSVGFNVVYVLLRQVFAQVTTVSDVRSELAVALDDARGMPRSLPADTRVFRFSDSVFFANAYRAKMSVLEAVKTHHSPIFISRDGVEAERNWSVSGEKRLAKLRRLAGVRDPLALPRIRLVIIDFRRTNHVDTTTCTQFGTLVEELAAYGGPELLVRFTSMSDYVRQRFERAGWAFLEANEGHDDQGPGIGRVVRVYSSVASAVLAPGYRDRMSVVDGEKDLAEQEGKREVTDECVEKA
jgi:sodium-independent sulfate anion transporter 11